MSEKKNLSADVLLAIQIIAMCAFGYAQFSQMMKSVQGISPVWIICAEVFCLISVALAYEGWRKSPCRSTRQLLLVHGGWTMVFTSLLLILMLKASKIGWSWFDGAMFGCVAFATVCVLAVAQRNELGVRDPIVRGVLAAIFRGIPHLAMVYKIHLLGGGGLAELTLWAAHVSACTRILLLAATVYSVGWDRSRRGIAIGEGVSEVSWIVVTIVWYVSS